MHIFSMWTQAKILLMARALLPDETDEGTMLHWENFIYTVIE